MTRVTGEEKFLSADMALLVPLRIAFERTNKENPGLADRGSEFWEKVVTC
jgi:hypothetical protein